MDSNDMVSLFRLFLRMYLLQHTHWEGVCVGSSMQLGATNGIGMQPQLNSLISGERSISRNGTRNRSMGWESEFYSLL